MGTHELTQKLRALKELQAQIEQLEAEAGAVKDEVKAEMTARGSDELKIDVYTVRWQLVKTKRFDSSAFKATHKDLFEQYTRETTAKRFTIA